MDKTDTTANWRTSTRSNSQGACVEVGGGGGARVAVRDTRDPARAVTLAFAAGAWQAFLDSLSPQQSS